MWGFRTKIDFLKSGNPKPLTSNAQAATFFSPRIFLRSFRFRDCAKGSQSLSGILSYVMVFYSMLWYIIVYYSIIWYFIACYGIL